MISDSRRFVHSKEKQKKLMVIVMIVLDFGPILIELDAVEEVFLRGQRA